MLTVHRFVVVTIVIVVVVVVVTVVGAGWLGGVVVRASNL